jgi:periplasmic protein TonB
VLPGNDQNFQLLTQVKIMNTSSMSVNLYETLDIADFIKKILAICFGVVMTMSLFYMMYLLIKNDSIPAEAPTTPPIPAVNFVDSVIDIIHTTETPPIKPTIIELPPTSLPPLDPDTGITKITRLIDDLPIDKVKPVININTSNQSLPMVKFAPAYPQAAITRGIEGYVDVVFDVTETGTTENIQIVYAEPAKIFNSAVLKAVARWKYKPKSDDVGNPVKMFGLRERLRFTMEK